MRAFFPTPTLRDGHRHRLARGSDAPALAPSPDAADALADGQLPGPVAPCAAPARGGSARPRHGASLDAQARLHAGARTDVRERPIVHASCARDWRPADATLEARRHPIAREHASPLDIPFASIKLTR